MEGWFKLLLFIALCSLYAVNARRHHVFSGGEAEANQYPWMTTVAFENGLCGGALISVNDRLQKSDVVLTAAHCVTKKVCAEGQEENCPWLYHGLDKLLAVFGNHNISDTKERGEQVGKPKKIVAHPCWQQGDKDECKIKHAKQVWFANDLGLIFLKEPVEYTKQIQPLHLPDDDDSPPRNAKCTLAGWGDHKYKAKEEQKKASDVLRSLDVQFMKSKIACATAYKFKLRAMQNFVCAQTNSPNQTATACQGDSGGPVWCEEDGYQVVFATVSANMGFCGGKYPGLFTNVGKFLDWIYEQIEEHSEVARTVVEDGAIGA